MRDPLESRRKPPLALYMRDGRYDFVIRSISDRIAERGVFDREDTFFVGPVDSDQWVTWELSVVWATDERGAIVLKRNGEIVHEEYGKPNAYNDLLGPIVEIGVYKYIQAGISDERESYFDDIEIFLQQQ